MFLWQFFVYFRVNVKKKDTIKQQHKWSKNLLISLHKKNDVKCKKGIINEKKNDS